ncbi:MAG TPA: amidohydrolase family protein, partial [Thermomicrobiales bacterium]|nr:amidohydrolase family protein [Thermomicrobiales bacterium]
MTDLVVRDRAPDLILTGGRVVTMDPDLPEATALAVKDGYILAVGGDRAIEEMAGSGTRQIALSGRLTIPGIIDTHNHMISMGAVLNEVQLYAARSIDEIKALVAERVRTSPPGAWILGRGWDESLLADKRFPTRH